MSAYEALFKQYIDVCNQAIEGNSHRFPFKQILSAAKSSAKNRIVEVELIDDRPVATYALYWGAQGATFKSHDQCKNCLCDSKWRVKKSYLDEVLSNPEAYIKNPAKIDWDWLYGGIL